jgi:alpha-ketoglutaric semialdehyde dehydrogenase
MYDLLGSAGSGGEPDEAFRLIIAEELSPMAHKNFINGQWIEAQSGKMFESLNPATGEVLGILPRSGPAEADAAVDAACAAYDSWRLTPAPKRAEVLFRAGELLLRRKEDVARLMTEEMGKVLPEARGDVQEGIDMTFYLAGEGRRLMGETVPSELRNKFAMSVRAPVGVAVAITPWNFPLAIPTWKLMAGLVAGNAMVFKPASDTPLVACALVEVLEEAGLPSGALNMVLGPGPEVGHRLVENPKVALVSFTGSTVAGKSVALKATENLKRVSLEMGGKNAIIVLEDADLDLAVEGIIWSAFGTSGQRCTAASRIIAHRAIKDDLTDRLVKRTTSLRLGNGLDPETDVGPIINQSQLEKIDRYVKIGQSQGARLLVGGDICREGPCARGFFYWPTLFDNVTPSMRIAQEEIFGPVAAIITVGDLDEAIAVNNNTPYGLSSSIYTRDVNKAFRAMRDISTGIVYVNAGTIGAEVQLPFGGTRGTGNGHREGGQTVLDIFTEWKTLYVDYSGRLQKAQMDS